MNLATNYLGLLTQSAVAGAGSLAELQPSARLGKNFPVGWWVARKAENKAKAQHNWGFGFAELGNQFTLLNPWVVTIYDAMLTLRKLGKCRKIMNIGAMLEYREDFLLS